jgi:hypothetical protein
VRSKRECKLYHLYYYHLQRQQQQQQQTERISLSLSLSSRRCELKKKVLDSYLEVKGSRQVGRQADKQIHAH